MGGGNDSSSQKRAIDASGRLYTLSCSPANRVEVQNYPKPADRNPGISDWLQPKNCDDCKDWTMISVSRPPDTSGWAGESVNLRLPVILFQTNLTLSLSGAHI